MASRESDREAGGLYFEGWQQRFVDARGLRFSAVAWGEARRPALVLLHGLTVEAHCWDPFANALQDEFQLIAFDLRGHGDSDWPQPPSYETQDFVDDLAALAGRWPLERFSLVGHSSGAAAAFAFALSHPDMVERLIVLDPAPLGGAAGAPPWAALPAYDSFEAMVEAMAQVYPRSRPEWVRHWAAHNGRRLADGSWTRKHSPDVQELRLAPLWDLVSRIRCPTFIVRGELSNAFTTADAARLTDTLPAARLITIESAGHPVAQERPAELAAAVRAFLAPPV